jgi:hypothetical protein
MTMSRAILIEQVALKRASLSESIHLHVCTSAVAACSRAEELLELRRRFLENVSLPSLGARSVELNPVTKPYGQ